MIVTVARHDDVEGWAQLRAILWPEETIEEHRAAIVAWRHGADRIAFVATEGGMVIGFAEAALRQDHVNGCDTSPVAFLEGLAIAAAHRRKGVGRALVAAVEAWGAARGCTELGSDADEENDEGRAMHRRLGFEERERVVFYRKLIGANGSTLS